MKLEIGDVINTFDGEQAKITVIFYDKKIRPEKSYVLDKIIKIKNSKEPYGNPNREQFVYRKDYIIETSDIKTTVKSIDKKGE